LQFKLSGINYNVLINFEGSVYMAVFSKDERVKILSDIIEIQSVNEKELDVAHYLQQLFKKYDIHTEILKIRW